MDGHRAPSLYLGEEMAVMNRSSISCFRNYNNTVNETCEGGASDCFCSEFEKYIPSVYLSFSAVSAVCCCGVFITYFCFPKFKQTGTSSKVFLYRYDYKQAWLNKLQIAVLPVQQCFYNAIFSPLSLHQNADGSCLSFWAYYIWVLEAG